MVHGSPQLLPLSSLGDEYHLKVPREPHIRYFQPIFYNFNRLPLEIRTMVWRFIIPDARVVPIMYNRVTGSYVARMRPPTILHVTRESRSEGLKIYHEINLGPLVNAGCYVDLTRDTVYLKTDLTHSNNTIMELATSEPIYSIRGGSLHSTDYLRKDEGRDRAATLPFHSHCKTILNDLFHSEDGLHILKLLHVDTTTWKLMQTYFAYYRYQVPAHPCHVILVYERPNSVLPNDIVLNGIPFMRPFPVNSVNKLVSSFRATNHSRNRKDSRRGREPVLVTHFVPKFLDGKEGDVVVLPLEVSGATGIKSVAANQDMLD